MGPLDVLLGCQPRPRGGAALVRENGCPWNAFTRDEVAAELGYTDDFGNLVDHIGNPIPSDDE